MHVCPRCGEENPEHARFCLRCGEPLAATEPGRQERKFATALFADLVGSTALAEHEDPEVVQAVVGRAFDRLAEEVTRHEGLLEKFMGDAILAVFGVPRAHEDDAERAVNAGMEMQAVLSELNREFEAEGKPQLAMRIGVEAGEVLVDVERASGPRDRMLTGDAVNVAARLQSAAEPGRVIVGPTAHEATRAVIEYRELTPLTLKGKAEPVPAWDALRVRARQRGERPELGMEAKLVGRDEELAVLVQTFQRVQADRRPALVTVVGPAGVGKSRLGREFERHIDGLTEFVYWRRGRCMAYGNTAYSALADAVKAQCEIFDDDATEVAWKKVNEAVESLFGDKELAPQIGALVGAGEPGAFSREDLFDAWRRFFERMAARYPLVLVFEDIHWADDALLDFTEYLADWAQGPIMVLTLARPELFENRPAWGGGKRNAVSTFLDPLSADESSAMLVRPARRRHDRGPGARGRGAQRRQPAVRRGDRPQADRRRRPARDERRDVGGGEAHHRRRTAAFDPRTDRDAAGRPAGRREGGDARCRRGRTRLLVRCGRHARRPDPGTGAGRPRPTAREGARPPHRSARACRASWSSRSGTR